MKNNISAEQKNGGKLYFATVQFFSPCNAVAKSFNIVLRAGLHQHMIYSESWGVVVEALRGILQNLYDINPRCQPFEVAISEHTDIFGNTAPLINIHRKGNTEAHVAIVNTAVVMNYDADANQLVDIKIDNP